MKYSMIKKVLLCSMLLIVCIACNDIRVTNPRTDGIKIAKKMNEAQKSNDQVKVLEAVQYLKDYENAYIQEGRPDYEILELYNVVNEFAEESNGTN